jgi:RND family efflux transporter MFP subunit
MKKTVIYIFVAICILVVSFITIRAGSSKTASADVTVAVAKDGSLDNSVTADGSLVAANIAQVNVLPSITAQVKAVYVNVGDHVRKGQIVAELDPTDMLDNLAESVAVEQEAKWRHELIKRPYQTEQISELKARIAGDQAAIKSASDHIKILENLRRPEEIQEAEDAVRIASNKYELAKSVYSRNKELNSKDLLPRADLEASETEMNVTGDAANQAKEALSLLKQGARREEIDIAKSDLTQAKFTLEQDRQALALRNKQGRPEAIAESSSRMAELSATTRHLRHVAERRYVRAPIDGIIVARGVNPGEIAVSSTNKSDVLQPVDNTPAKSLFTIADDKSLEFQANVDQMYYSRIKTGQEAVVTIDSLPGGSFKGEVTRINQVINPETNVPNNSPVNPATPLTFIVRVRISNPTPELAIGQIGAISIHLDKAGVLVPSAAVTPIAAGKGFVYVVKNGYVNARSVAYDGGSQGCLRLLNGVQPGELVVVGHAKTISDGMRAHAMAAGGDDLSSKAF